MKPEWKQNEDGYLEVTNLDKLLCTRCSKNPCVENEIHCEKCLEDIKAIDDRIKAREKNDK